jgi:sarcosine oxidase
MSKTNRRAVLRGIAAIAAAGTFAARAGRAAETAARGSKTKWDVIVVGAGVFGAWTAWKLHRLGQKVLLVDAWGPAHSRASSGGESRLTRTEYGGDELYTRMAWDSLRDWKTLSEHSGPPIFHPVGALYMYQQERPEIATSVALHERLGIPMIKLSRAQMVKRYPQIGFDGIVLGILQPTMGALMARRAVQTLVAQFTSSGGEYRQISIQPPRAGTTLDSVTGNGSEVLQASKYVFACGPWMPKLFPDVIGSRILPTRQDVFFFAPAGGDVRFQGEHLPAWVDPDHPNLYYGFPSLEQRGFKIALDAHGPKFDPDGGDRLVTAAAIASIREYLAKRFPALARRPLSESRVCQYENSESGDFIIDRHPTWTNTWLVGGGSGHGFKHGPEVGRYTAELVTGRLRNVEPRFALAKHATQEGAS